MSTSAGVVSVQGATAGTAGAVNGLTITVKDAAGNVRTAASNALSSFSETQAAIDKRTDGSASFQIGANTGQTMNLSIENMGASALGVQGLKISTQSQATVAIKVIDTATQKKFLVNAPNWVRYKTVWNTLSITWVQLPKT
ncbi:hypothetical protein ACFSQ7_05015 [Paenibacillus rhizoplanae]